MKLIKKYHLELLGILVGAILGYAYYYFVGCRTGSCPITSKPMNSMLYGMVLGALLFSSARKTQKKNL